MGEGEGNKGGHICYSAALVGLTTRAHLQTELSKSVGAENGVGKGCLEVASGMGQE